MIVDYDNAIDLSSAPIGTVYLTGGGFVNRAFSGWGTNSLYGWQEMVWSQTPNRSQSFQLKDMDNIAVGLVARCEISTEYMNAQDYMDLRKIVGRERHFLATFYDADENKWVTRDMYCSENSKNQLFVLGQKLIGMRGISIKLVGTNLDLTTVIDYDGQEIPVANKLSFVYNIDRGAGTVATQTASYGTFVKLDGGTGISAPAGEHLAGWCTKENAGTANEKITGYYGLGQTITVWNGLTLYPWYENAQ